MNNLVNKKFSIVTENTMTVSSRNATGVEVWEVKEIINEEKAKCELLDTNMSMYSGGYCREFYIELIEGYLNK
jgi:hypothetical protein